MMLRSIGMIYVILNVIVTLMEEFFFIKKLILNR